ncbi:MAG TPA: MFS transporter [Stellaceae bacterium]|nr:MFS transporter [Stellaceae bacterium]
MAELHLSATEATLENQRIGGLQLKVALICALVQMCDGYDVGSIGWAVPQLTHAWNLAPPAFALAFLFSNIGIMVGALVAGPIGDRIGRKPLLLGSVSIFAIASLLSALAPSLSVLAMLRFFTGLGIAGGFAGTTALTGDYAPKRLRQTLILVTFTGAPIGSFVGGQIVALMLHEGLGWPSIFVLGGLFPLVLVLVMAFFMPESPRYLAQRGRLAPRDRLVLERLGLSADGADAKTIDIARSNPVKMLFSEGYAMQTVLLWIVFFCSLIDLYLFLFWLPEILHLSGLTPAEAVFATSLHGLGGVFAVFYLGFAMDRFGADKALSLHFAIGIIFIVLIALVAMPYLALLALCFLTGLTVIGSQTGANAACGALYPARMRTSAIGWALGIGRLGGIAAAPLGGYLLAAGLKPTHVLLSACIFAAIAAAATAALAVSGRRIAAPSVVA